MFLAAAKLGKMKLRDGPEEKEAGMPIMGA
jgi:hypothetical protein